MFAFGRTKCAQNEDRFSAERVVPTSAGWAALELAMLAKHANRYIIRPRWTKQQLQLQEVLGPQPSVLELFHSTCAC